MFAPPPSDNPLCPVCLTPSQHMRADTPYHMCNECACWFQSPLPPKLLHGEHETWVGKPMPDDEKNANKAIAEWLFKDWMHGKIGFTLDIGASYPWLAKCLHDLGNYAIAIDPSPEILNHPDAPAVPRWQADFEDVKHDILWKPSGKMFSLITLVHTFEHLYNPLAALKKIYNILDPDGAVFIRMPDHNVKGFERDLTPGHYTIHPYFYTFRTILQMCWHLMDMFVVDYCRGVEPGQTDIVLRPVTKRPVIALGMIVKNEERDIPRCLISAAGAVDLIYINDTGSTDRTREVFLETVAEGDIVHSYQMDMTGCEREGKDWKLWNFAAARNKYLDRIDKTEADWVLNLDADDELRTPNAVRRASYFRQADSFSLWIQDGSTKWTTHRLWKTRKGIRYEGRCHEYPTIPPHDAVIMDSLIIHHGTPSASQENSNPRNLRILLREWAEKPTPRCAFYLANTYRDARQWTEAIQWYDKRLAFDKAIFPDEWLFSLFYKARSLRFAKQYDEAIAVADEGLTHTDWSEFHMEKALCLFDLKRYSDCIEAASKALDKPISPTNLWREANMYRDQPARLIAHAHDQLGNTAQALAWAVLAEDRIGTEDKGWKDFVSRLKTKTIESLRGNLNPPVNKRKHIALLRPGAIGDILMTLNLIPALKEANPGAGIHYFCDEKIGKGLDTIMRQAGVDVIMPHQDLEIYKDQFTKVITLTGYPLAEGYPEKPMQHHLLQYFARELDLEIFSLEKGFSLPQLTLPRPDRPIDTPAEAYCTIQMRAGWSKYKEWMLGSGRWEAVYAALEDKIPLILIDEARGWPLDKAIAVFANARMHVGIDSFCNHLTNYLWTYTGGARRVPGVILWGSTQASAAGYADNINISKGLPCQPCFRENPAISRQPRGPCIQVGDGNRHPYWGPAKSYDDPHPHRCMDAITVEEVVDAILEMWERTSEKRPAEAGREN